MTLIRIIGNDYSFSREAADKLEQVRGNTRYDIASMYPLPILCRRGGGRF